MDFNKNIDYNGRTLINFVNVSAAESDLILCWRNHDAIRKWMYKDHVISSEEHRKYLHGLNNAVHCSSWIVKNIEGVYLGVLALNKIDLVNRNAYLGIYANPVDTIPGAGTVLMECLKHVAFNLFSLHSLRLEVIDTNERAISFYKKVGFGVEGKLRDFVCKKGSWINVDIMSIINPEDKSNGI
ncbi:MAG: UDP-4-amino-4,6-dideoxy-N-acetyl-beta-L-altrosamine N-acetyltransferase [Elusimicrobiota bacterium]